MRCYTLTRDEQAKVLRSTSPKGGGMQAALYRLACSLEGDTLTVDPELFERFQRYLETMGADEGGWQGRLPAEMLADLTGRPAPPRDEDLF